MMPAFLNIQVKHYLDDYLARGKFRYGFEAPDSPDDRDERFEHVAAEATLRPNRATG
jgi:hypothetical protein